MRGTVAGVGLTQVHRTAVFAFAQGSPAQQCTDGVQGEARQVASSFVWDLMDCVRCAWVAGACMVHHTWGAPYPYHVILLASAGDGMTHTTVSICMHVY